MAIDRKIILAIALACMVIGGLAAAHGWYFRRYAWPAEIQQNLFGRQIASSDSLLTQEGFSAYGEGMFRWRYQVEAGGKAWDALCLNHTFADCKFTKTRRLDDGVDQTASYADGILTLEEVWS